MNFRNMILALSAMTASVGIAAGFEAGKGVANDLATGANQRDVTFVERGGDSKSIYELVHFPLSFLRILC